MYDGSCEMGVELAVEMSATPDCCKCSTSVSKLCASVFTRAPVEVGMVGMDTGAIGRALVEVVTAGMVPVRVVARDVEDGVSRASALRVFLI